MASALGGRMPMTVNVSALRRIVLPIRFVSPLKRRRQSASVTSTTRLSWPSLSSFGRKSRPTEGCTRRICSKLAETCQPLRRSGCPSVPVRFMLMPEMTDSASKLAQCSCQSRNAPPETELRLPGCPASNHRFTSCPGSS